MLITDFRKGNAPGVGACLTPASAYTGKSSTHHVSTREKDIYIIYVRE